MRMLWRNTELKGVNVIDQPAPLDGTNEEKAEFVNAWNMTVNRKFYEVLARTPRTARGQPFRDLE